MKEEDISVLLATESLDEFTACYERHTGRKLENLGQIDVADGAMVEHFTKLMRKANEGTGFAPIKLPDGREIFISPYIRKSDKKSR